MDEWLGRLGIELIKLFQLVRLGIELIKLFHSNDVQ